MSGLLGGLARAVFSTWKIRARLSDRSELAASEYPFAPEIFAVCERDAFALAGTIVGRGVTVLVANGRDGDLATRALEGIGCRVVRGSHGRGGVHALRSLIRDMEHSVSPAAIVVDGPLGPVGEPKAGVFLCARESGRPIIPVGAAARRPLVLRKAWSRLYIPPPMSMVSIVAGEPLRVAPDTATKVFPELAAELRRRLAKARSDAVAWSREGALHPAEEARTAS